MRNLIKSAALVAGVAIGGMRGFVRGLQEPAAATDDGSTSSDPVNAVGRLGWKSWGLIFMLLGSVAAVGGWLLVASGVVPIKASSGHWPITEWILHYSMKRSIATHSLGIHAPDLNDPALVLRGAGHYHFGCRPCHGSPDFYRPQIAASMTPAPPYLAPDLSKWKPRELFYLVKHGVKFTGMPAWPSQRRDDEVWAMVAFLQQFPRLNAQEYLKLAGALSDQGSDVPPMEGLMEPAGVPSVVTDSCARCHGVDGQGRGTGAFPKIAGQRPEYLYASLRAFSEGRRYSGIMQPLAAALADREMREVALFYGRKQHGRSEEARGDVALGKVIAEGGLPDHRIPACTSCHGSASVENTRTYPHLAGQYSNYMLLQLQLLKSGNRGGTSYAHIMREVVRWLDPEEMHAVAAYYASLEPQGAAPAPASEHVQGSVSSPR